MASALAIRYQSEQTTIATYYQVALVFALQEPSQADLDAFVSTVRAIGDGTSKTVGLLLAVSGQAHPPAAPARAGIIDAIRAVSPRVSGFAGVIMGEGFSAAAMRSVFAAVIFGARTPFPSKTFGALSEAADWLAEQIDVPRSAPVNRAGLAGEAQRLLQMLRRES